MAILQSMPIIDPEKRQYVVVGVFRNRAGELLVQQRLPGKPCEGRWEFPGGKCEDNEKPKQALIRELKEELGVCVTAMTRLIELGFDYSHANVWLDVYLIEDFTGEVSNREGQSYQWLPIEAVRKLDLLAAVFPILNALDKCSARSAIKAV